MTGSPLWLAGKIAVVTGASAGIGTEIALGLARLGASVAVVGRNFERTHDACARIEHGGGTAEAFHADFAVVANVRHLAAELADRYPHVDILVNNAGTAVGRRRVTHDGFEMTFAVNHLAPFLLTHLLLPRLKMAPRARIVTVASGAHWRGRMDFDDRQHERAYSAWEAYSRSKLANVLFTRALARRLIGSTVTATCCHPGVAATDIWREGPGSWFYAPLLRLFLQTPARCADTPVWLAAAPEAEGQSGGYYKRRHLAPTSPSAQDDSLAERLWEVSAAMCEPKTN